MPFRASRGTSLDDRRQRHGHGLALVLAGVAPAVGITFGHSDGEAHPSVGLIMYRQEFPHPDLGEFLSLGPAYVSLSQNPARGDGGTCYGDSGGPNFLRLEDGREVVAAVTVTGDDVCRATSVDARVDTANARSFLANVPGLVLP